MQLAKFRHQNEHMAAKFATNAANASIAYLCRASLI